ncbi:MAG: hypothetical protein QXK76_02065 [Candidatus Woesearchaeota archaeon]
MNIVPPEVPKLESEKKGFFKKLFSLKKDSDKNMPKLNEDKINTPMSFNKETAENINENFKDKIATNSTLENTVSGSENNNLPELPELPPLDVKGDVAFNEKTNIEQKTIKAKKQKNTSQKKDKNIIISGDADTNSMELSKLNFDWSSSISPQENIILDNNRNNEDIKNLITASDQHIQDQKTVLNNKVLTLPDKIPEINIKTPIVPEIKTDAVPMAKSERLFFNKVDKEHKKLREELKKSMKHYTKEGFIRLLKQYDDKIESIIEQKQIEYSNKANELSKLSKELNEKQKELIEWNKRLKSLEEKLKLKEKELEKTVTKHVEKQLIKRSKKEREMLKKELQKTISMNNSLKKKIESLEKDREKLEKIKKDLMDEYRKKEITLQKNYENKFEELKKERMEFEERRKKALALLHKADLIRREKENLDRLKEIIAKKRESLKETIEEDVELKNAIEESEKKLAEERANLDNMIFSKYIKWKLSDDKEKEDISEILKNPEVDEINNLIVECRTKLVNNDFKEAKRIYNIIKNKFENSKIDDYNKSLLFNSIMELFNDIKIAMLKV